MLTASKWARLELFPDGIEMQSDRIRKYPPTMLLFGAVEVGLFLGPFGLEQPQLIKTKPAASRKRDCRFESEAYLRRISMRGAGWLKMVIEPWARVRGLLA